MKTGILFAAKPEAAAILGTGYFGWKKEGGFYQSSKTSTLLCISGIGKVKAVTAALQLAQHTQRIFLLGTSAALTAELPLFTFCLPEEFVLSTEKSSFFQDKLLSEELSAIVSKLHFSFRQNVKLTSTDEIIAEKQQAENLHQNTGAILADMESVAVLQALSKTSVPAAVLRAISNNPVVGGSPENSWQKNTAKISVQLSQIMQHLLQEEN